MTITNLREAAQAPDAFFLQRSHVRNWRRATEICRDARRAFGVGGGGEGGLGGGGGWFGGGCFRVFVFFGGKGREGR